MLQARLALSRILSCLITLGLAVGTDGADSIGDEDGVAVANRISELVVEGWAQRGIDPAPGCDDREFVRRVYLDLAGRIPRLEELGEFLASEDREKRRRLVSTLVRSEDYARHFADMFDTLLMGRASDQQYDARIQQGWRGYLESVFRDNRPWNEVARELVLARPTSPRDSASVWFVYERENDFQKIAEAVAPTIFGIRVECAQCHDHPMASEIEQAHYWGLVAFFNRGKNIKTDNGPRVGESAIGGFSEFADLTGESQPNRLTFLQVSTIDEARPDGDDKQEDLDHLYQPATIRGDPRVPRFSRRQKFADEVAAGHPLVARAMVNRIWAMLVGRGIVHPFDEMDSAHEPSHPELLDWLANDYATSGFDTRRLVEAIVLSEPYQRSSRKPAEVDDPASLSWYLERPLTAEQLARSIQVGVRGEWDDQSQLVREMRSRILEVMPEENVTGVKTALFLTNHASLNDFLRESTSQNHLVPRLLHLDNRQQQVDLLFQTVFGREAGVDERQAIEDYVSGRDNEEGWRQVLWSLLTSAEFRFNH